MRTYVRSYLLMRLHVFWSKSYVRVQFGIITLPSFNPINIMQINVHFLIEYYNILLGWWMHVDNNTVLFFNFNDATTVLMYLPGLFLLWLVFDPDLFKALIHSSKHQTFKFLWLKIPISFIMEFSRVLSILSREDRMYEQVLFIFKKFVY